MGPKTKQLKTLQRIRQDIVLPVLLVVAFAFLLVLTIELQGVLSLQSGNGRRLWAWYLGHLSVDPLRSLLLPLEILFGLSALYLLVRNVPSWHDVQTNGGSMFIYFLLESLYWIVALVELPVAIMLLLLDAPLIVYAANFGLVLLMMAVVIFIASRREKYKSKKFRAFLTPLVSLATPGLSGMGRMHRLHLLPKAIGDLVDDLLRLVQDALMSTAKIAVTIHANILA